MKARCLSLNTIIVILVLFSSLTAAVTVAFVVKTLGANKKRYSQRKTIIEQGTSAQAVINSIQQTKEQMDDQPEVLLDLTVSMPDGKVISTVVKTFIPIINVPTFQKGNVIEVKVMTIDNEQKFEVVGSYLP
jgi:cell division protein YceG involved in septum cleavage